MRPRVKGLLKRGRDVGGQPARSARARVGSGTLTTGECERERSFAEAAHGRRWFSMRTGGVGAEDPVPLETKLSDNES